MIHRPPPDAKERVDLIKQDRPLIEKRKNGLSPHETVRRIYSDFASALSLTQKDRDSEEENHRMYTGLNFGQYPKELKSALEASGSAKDMSQFNFVMKKVNDAVGNLTNNWYDIDFLSVDGVGSDTVQVFKDLYYMEKDLCDWECEINDFLVNGMIKSADLMMYIDYRYDNAFGNIAVKSMPPGSVIRDVNWTSKNSGDCRSAYTVSYMTAKEIKEKYRSKSERIDMLIKLSILSDETTRDLYGTDSLPRFRVEEEYNKEYRVIEKHYMVTEKRDKKYGFSGEYMVEVPSDAGEEWFIYNNVDKDNLITSSEMAEVYYVTAIAPELDSESPLEDRRGMLQLGRLPLIHWSYNRHNGKDIGIVDLLRDPQRFYNQMLSLSKEIIAYSKRVRLIDPAMFDDDIGNLDELEKKINTPGATVFGKANFSLEYPNGIQEATPSTYTGNELQLAQTALSASEMMTPINSAMAGQGKGDRSAEQFNAKREQGEINSTMLNDSVKQFNNELAECYFYAAQSLHGGMYRSFPSSKGNIEINVPLPDGRVVNNILDVPRTKVIVTESPEGVTKRTNDRVAAYQALQYMGGSSPTAGTYLLEIIFDSMDNLSKARKEEIKQGIALDREVIRASQSAQVAQAQAMVQQSQAPAPVAPEQGQPQQQGQGQPPVQSEQPVQEGQPTEPVAPEEAQVEETITE